MKFYENIIIGAGPAGLQLAYYFSKNNINYVVIEKENKCGSFFDKYPHSGKLISINKIYNGNDDPDFNLRHDWNSLLNDDNFLFKNYSRDYYPESKDLYKYLNEFALHFNLNILFNTTVKKVTKNHNNETYDIFLDDKEMYNCNKLIVSSGMNVPNISSCNKTINDKKLVLHYSQFPKGYFRDEKNLEKYTNKRLAIIGGGNASYELGNMLMSYCSSIIIVSKPMNKGKNLSIISHYSGDIRSVYYPFLDSFYLKSLNGISTYEDIKNLKIMRIDDKNDKNYNKFILINCDNNMMERYLYDEIILCTGYRFNNNIFSFPLLLCNKKKYPLTKYNYESINNKNLFFIGSLMHVHDNGRSSGGFIHGFRYLIKLFTNINYNIPFVNFKFKYNNDIKECYRNLCYHIMYRINNASSLYQMYGVLCDIFYYDNINKEIVYYHDLSQEYALKNMNELNICLILLNYGPKIINIYELGAFHEKDPKFLHCKIYNYTKQNNEYICINETILPEELLLDFSCDHYYELLYKAIKNCTLII